MLCNLPHRVSVQNSSQSATGGGTYVDTWTTVKTIWANVQPLSSQEGAHVNYASRKEQEIITHNVITRYDSYITNKHRLLFNSRILKIEAVSDMTERERMVKIKCREEST